MGLTYVDATVTGPNDKSRQIRLLPASKYVRGSGIRPKMCREVAVNEISASGDMFYKWQYEIRWAADNLRRDGILAAAVNSPRGVWQLASNVSA